MSTTLGISTLAYAPWTFFNYLMPIGVFVMTLFGFLTVKIEDDPGTVIEAKESL
jgi:Na+/H+ antiporter NhaC